MTKRVKFGIYVPNYGNTFGNAVNLANLAKLAESHNWDGFFIWDHILVEPKQGPKICNPWIALGLMGYVTEKIIIGSTVTPLPRRKPWELAREVSTVDQISNGRVILGVGLGHPPEVEYKSFGEDTNVKIRREKLDESLAILQGLWKDEVFSFKGKHYNLEEMTFVPKPVNKTIPIWVAGQYPLKGPINRASKYNGMIPLPMNFDGDLSLKDFQDITRKIISLGGKSSFDLVRIMNVPTSAESSDDLLSFSDAGVTWFLHFFKVNTALSTVEKRIKQGVPEI